MARFSRVIPVLLAAVLAVPFFSSCDKVPSWIDDIVNRDTEYADFIIKGSVKGPDGNPLSGIKVEVSILRDYSEYVETKSFTTSSEGTFSYETQTAQIPDAANFLFTDPRGDYPDALYSGVQVERTKEEKGKYLGEFTVTADVVIEKK